jgi:hypothetical protein
MDGIPVTADEVMPASQGLSLRYEPVGAGPGQPADGGNGFCVQRDAIRDVAAPLRVVAALTAAQVQKLAGNIREVDNTVVLVFELLQTAEPAAVAE